MEHQRLIHRAKRRGRRAKRRKERKEEKKDTCLRRKEKRMESKAVLLTGYSGKKEGFGAVCLSRNQENHEPYEWLEGWCNAVLKRARGATAKCNVDDK